jgi:hypothetical protein
MAAKRKGKARRVAEDKDRLDKWMEIVGGYRKCKHTFYSIVAIP